MHRTPLIAANWKMNGSAALAQDMTAALNELSQGTTTVVVCPPATLLTAFTNPKTFALGGQTLSHEVSGAFTGELSANLLLEAGATYVIVGHSERRELNFETDALIAAKLSRAVAAGLTPILCVGESLSERQQEKTQQVLARQLDAVYASQPELLANSVIAYEPIWAIGTGESATPEQAQATHHFIRQHLAKYNSQSAVTVKLLYGGSVNADNCVALFQQADIDGALVGGASLKPVEFAQICLAVTKGAKE
ncbi:triose-phosphate isomerase [Rheinheimera baltica]|uniref:triose-phosphate isomerase n=1 Tax=Rheinheimera baltica TaxID=67576 RepID=UPI000425C5DF|nr:triose-phosphate isomerase [Rheinheimera baltica]MDP5141863.1 triose-phosphate isomerase [Rheinheimera baltica]MDP5150150.1 triose-phosphate isomerase [Rheinheimera baltica]MDP5191659.1 triose-phosphate isomerase [Rheinheimera baltica]